MSQQTIGGRLRQARESMPASLIQASRETRIRVDFLESMEQDNFKFVSGFAYVKGMLTAYGKWLSLDERALSEEFNRMHGEAGMPSVSQMVREPTKVPPRPRPKWLLAAIGAAVLMLAFSLIGVMRPATETASQPEPIKQPAQSSGEDQNGAGTGASEQEPGAGGLSVDPADEPPAFTGDGVQLTLTVVGDSSWVEAYADGNDADAQALFRGLLKSGDSRTFEGNQRVRMLIGNMGAVRISVNGRDLGVAGATGQVGDLVFDRQTTSLPQG